MSKDYIKQILRENLIEAEAQQQAEKEKNTSYESDYKEIQNKLLNGILKMAQVMELSGIGKADSATDRSLFGKKLHMEKNNEGSVYKFSPEEVKKLKQVLSNPNSNTHS